MAAGYVYIMVNASMPGLVKIGKTTKLPEQRAAQLHRTGVPFPFIVAHFVRVSDCGVVERLIHDRLKRHRVYNRREFFKVPLEEAKRELDLIADGVGRLAAEKLDAPPIPTQAATPARETDQELARLKARRRRKTEQSARGFIIALFAMVLLSCCGAAFFLSVLSPKAKDSAPDREPESNQPIPNKRDAKGQAVPVEAPPPRPVHPFPPRSDYTSSWKRAGRVELRIAGVAVTKVPISDSSNRPTESKYPHLVIWIEARTDATDKPVVMRRWQGLSDDCWLTDRRGRTLSGNQLGPGEAFRFGSPYNQTVVPNGTPVYDILGFTVPPVEVGELLLTLSAERVSESGRVQFAIPASAWKK